MNNADDIILAGEKLCPVTHKKCQSLCPAPMTTSDSYTEDTGWSGGKIGKCQESIYLMFDSKDGKSTEIRYLPVEVYTNARLPMLSQQTDISNIIGWGNYEKELNKTYRNPFESHIFFENPVFKREQKNFIGQTLTKVTPMNLQLSKIPLQELAEIRFGHSGKKIEEVCDNFRSGFLLDLRSMRMIKESTVLNGANNMYSSASGEDFNIPSTPYETPVNYKKQYEMYHKMQSVYQKIQQETPQLQELIKIENGHGEGIKYKDVQLTFEDIDDIVKKYACDHKHDHNIPREQLLDFVIDKITKIYIHKKVFDHFLGSPLFMNNSEDKNKQYPDLYIYAWDNPFDNNDFDFTLYHLSGEEIITNIVNFPEVNIRVPEGCEPPRGADNADPKGLESELGMEVLQSYFIDAGVQVGAISAPMRTYLKLLGSTYVANLTSYKK
ncbi:hypothetical protein MNBD_GAMMA10-2868 [hydrothermal vent metagenome]|uniref:Uncharacterized protein n=1 Tax=hydrothermal vent metagenome TaxID=652676 RepID=A0A3B0Y581_9ZZZZ